MARREERTEKKLFPSNSIYSNLIHAGGVFKARFEKESERDNVNNIIIVVEYGIMNEYLNIFVAIAMAGSTQHSTAAVV